jgi:glycosyltransferase involved in cell wall biosynthesis
MLSIMAARLGLYVDDVYRLVATPSGRVISSDRAFLVFAAEVAERFDALVLFGRAQHAEGEVEHELPARTEIVELPFYEDLTHLSEVIRATPATVRRMWQGLGRVDIVWIFGPHPFALVLALLALVRRKRIVLGVRQDTRAYYRNRLRRPIWAPALALTSAIDRAFRFLARRTAVTTVGPDITRSYGGGSRVLDMTVTLVRSADVAEQPGEHAWTEAIGLLAVGRLEQEKNPLLLVQALERLEALRPGRYGLTWVGRGPLEEEVLRAARGAGLSDRVELPGYVPFGDELLDRYRNAHLFVHVSLTEGLPQVLVEALASGTPIVATAVGSVGALLEEGGAGVLVRPAQLEELVDAILLLSEDEPLRRRLAIRGIELAKELTLEREGERVARFIAAAAASLPP